MGCDEVFIFCFFIFFLDLAVLERRLTRGENMTEETELELVVETRSTVGPRMFTNPGQGITDVHPSIKSKGIISMTTQRSFNYGSYGYGPSSTCPAEPLPSLGLLVYESMNAHHKEKSVVVIRMSNIPF